MSQTQTQPQASDAPQTKADPTAVWFEIPVADFDRARSYYERLFDIKLREEPMGPARMGSFPHSATQANGCIVAMEGCAPAEQGTVVYLHAAPDLQRYLDRVGGLGGTVLQPKTALPEGMGFYALMRDCEGNRVGLYSQA